MAEGVACLSNMAKLGDSCLKRIKYGDFICFAENAQLSPVLTRHASMLKRIMLASISLATPCSRESDGGDSAECYCLREDVQAHAPRRWRSSRRRQRRRKSLPDNPTFVFATSSMQDQQHECGYGALFEVGWVTFLATYTFAMDSVKKAISLPSPSDLSRLIPFRVFALPYKSVIGRQGKSSKWLTSDATSKAFLFIQFIHFHINNTGCLTVSVRTLIAYFLAICKYYGISF